MKSPLSIFSKSSNSFEGEEHGEKVILLVRRHPFFIIVRTILFIFLAVVPIVVGVNFYSPVHSQGFSSIFLFAVCLWYLFIWSSIFYAFTMYTLDVWIVTDRRIIDSTQRGFFNRTVSELHLNRVQDISVETKGLIQTFFKFGDLQVQTAGAEEKFKFLQIPNPIKVKDGIMKLTAALSPHHYP